MAKITISDVWRKHLKIIAYLVVSAVSAYVLSIITAKPEAIYLTPLINYILYAVQQELQKNGFVKAIRG